MLLAQISDLHFLPHGTLAFGRVDVAGCLERAIDHLAALQPRPDAVLITGDLTNDGDAAVWAELTGVLARLDAPVYPLPGNHDDRELMRSAFAHLDLFPAQGPLCFAVELGPLRLIGLDSLVPGDPAGELGAEQLAWLDARLGEAPQTPTLVALHHPPFRTGIDHMDAMMLTDGAALAAVIGRHPPGGARPVRPRAPLGAMPLRRHHRPDRAGRRARRAAGAPRRAAALDQGAAGHAAARMAGRARPGHPPRLHRRVRGRRVQRSAHPHAGIDVGWRSP